MKSRESETLTFADKKRIVADIKDDIDKGIYSQWPTLKDKLTRIGNKLFNSCYVLNCEPLSLYEIEILKENDYIEINN